MSRGSFLIAEMSALSTAFWSAARLLDGFLAVRGDGGDLLPEHRRVLLRGAHVTVQNRGEDAEREERRR